MFRTRGPLDELGVRVVSSTTVRPVARVVDLSVPIYEGMPVDDLGPKFWVRLSHAASRPLYQYTQSREGRVFLTTDHVGTHLDGPLRFDPQGRLRRAAPARPRDPPGAPARPARRRARPGDRRRGAGARRGRPPGGRRRRPVDRARPPPRGARTTSGTGRGLAMDGAEWLVRPPGRRRRRRLPGPRAAERRPLRGEARAPPRRLPDRRAAHRPRDADGRAVAPRRVSPADPRDGRARCCARRRSSVSRARRSST